MYESRVRLHRGSMLSSSTLQCYQNRTGHWLGKVGSAQPGHSSCGGNVTAVCRLALCRNIAVLCERGLASTMGSRMKRALTGALCCQWAPVPLKSACQALRRAHLTSTVCFQYTKLGGAVRHNRIPNGAQPSFPWPGKGTPPEHLEPYDVT